MLQWVWMNKMDESEDRKLQGCRSTTEIWEAKIGFEKLLGSINSLQTLFVLPHNSEYSAFLFFLLDSVILYKRNSKSCVAAKNIPLYFVFHALFTQDIPFK